MVMAHTAVAEYLLHTFRGRVGAGNYTYYKMTKEGNFKLVLTSLAGDADLYVSDQVLMPDYENYELCSVTCGVDVVEIDQDLKRPVSIGVYGHIFHEVSHFQLEVYADGISQYGKTYGGSSSHDEDSEEESIFLSIFVGLLKIIIDILV